MIELINRLGLPSACVVLAMLAGAAPARSETGIEFDIPAAIACRVVGDDLPGQSEKFVEVVIPFSVLDRRNGGQELDEILVAVYDPGAELTVTDYAPQTTVTTNIDGVVEVENHQETNATLGVNVQGSIQNMIGGDAQLGTGGKRSTVRRFHELPDQQLLVASGSVRRGSGVYYKFRLSGQTTLEGGRELAITFRVPASWRGGFLRVDCAATTMHKWVTGHEERRTIAKAEFVAALYLHGDTQAHRAVKLYLARETRLNELGLKWNSQRQSNGLLADLEASIFPSQKLPADWLDRLTLTDADQVARRIQPFLSKSLRQATDEFVAARREVLQLSR